MTARSPRPDDKHLVLVSSRSGSIEEVFCDDVGLFTSPVAAAHRERPPADRAAALEHTQKRVRGTMLSGFVAPGGAQHFSHFIDRLSRRGAISDWQIDLQYASDSFTYRLWAVTEADDDHATPRALLIGTTDLACSFEHVIANLEARVAALAAGGALAAAVARLRQHCGSADTVIDDLKTQVRGLHGHIQPPIGLENRLLRMAAHDLRNPLLVLSMGCSYLLHEANELSQEQRDMLSESLDTCDFMNRLVDGMTELAEVALGRLRLLREQTELGPLIERALRHGEKLASERASSLTLEHLAPVSMAVDPVRISRVVGQLISNALIHCPEGTEVRVRLDSAQDEAIIAVADNGPGIRPELRDKLFRPFGKPHGDIDPRYYGAGVGLAVARRIIEAHCGRLEVETHLGQGSCFRVILPLAARYHASP